MDRQQPRKDDRDNRRVARWGVIGLIAVVVAVITYNVLVFSRGDPRDVDAAPAAPTKPATAGATNSR